MWSLFARVLRRAVGTLLLVNLAAVVAGAAETPVRDALVYKDGDRVQGRLVGREGDVIIFESERFGTLRVPAAAADVKLAQPVAANVMPRPTPKPRAPEPEDESSIWGRFAPHALTSALEDLFGPWHGRFSFATEAVADTKSRDNTTVEARMHRKWTLDDVQVGGRYDYSQTNGVTTTDIVKADSMWRHELPRRMFTQYRPMLEWNRASFRAGQPSDYLLLQQEVGAGISLLNTTDRKLRTGVSENLFDVWTIVPVAGHSSRATESAFIESEWKLPWHIALTQRGTWYHATADEPDGWESRVELNKKLTETLSTAIRQESRHNSPDQRVQDYSRLRLLLALDF